MTKAKTYKGRSLWQDGLEAFSRNRAAMASCLFLLLLSIICLLAPWLTPYTYAAQDLKLGAVGPGAAHWLGTDSLGRDQLTRILYGGRVSLMVGVCATLVAAVIGVSWGAIAGFSGRVTDTIMMRIVDIIYAFPFTIFVIILMVFFKGSMVLLFCAIGAVEWLTMARIVRGQVLSLKQQEFVEAAVSIGLPAHRILLRHIFPHLLSPIIIYTTLTIPGVMLLEAFLSFLGLGVQPPASSWGILIREGAESMEQYPWLLIFPGVFLSCTLLAL
ncbi:MAG: ABC transporter permease subunit, partial [Chitinivibrionales bacterium]|nr:ABC transporter permease subunit [Chitinivibrionales bacterium]